jgi:transcriptional repressor NrdR
MNCPSCSSSETKVIDSRLHGGGTAIRRRRECLACQNRFSTLEELELLGLAIRKSDGRREAYNPEKLKSGLRRALEKRPCTDEQFRELVHAIEREVQAKRLDELSSRDLGEVVIKHLQRFDQVAYIRFASVYRDFQDLTQFREELDRLGPKKRQRTAG